MDAVGEVAHGGVGGRFEVEAEARGKTHGAEQAQVVLFQAALGAADGAEDASVEVGEAADVVDDGSCGERAFGEALRVDAEWIEQETVDGEVAALDIFFGAEGVADFVGTAAVGVSAVGAEGGDLNGHLRWGGLFGCTLRLGSHEDDAEVGADGESAREHVEDDVGAGAGGDVVVLGLAAEEQVADAAPGEVSLKARGAQRGEDAAGGGELVRGGHGCWMYCRAVARRRDSPQRSRQYPQYWTDATACYQRRVLMFFPLVFLRAEQ